MPAIIIKLTNVEGVVSSGKLMAISAGIGFLTGTTALYFTTLSKSDAILQANKPHDIKINSPTLPQPKAEDFFSANIPMRKSNISISQRWHILPAEERKKSMVFASITGASVGTAAGAFGYLTKHSSANFSEIFNLFEGIGYL